MNKILSTCLPNNSYLFAFYAIYKAIASVSVSISAPSFRYGKLGNNTPSDTCCSFSFFHSSIV